METSRSMRTYAALLTLLGALAGLPGASRAAEGVPPDLEVTYVGPNPNNRGEMLFRVTNVGPWWVAETTATVEVVTGARSPNLTIRVPDLDPKQEPQGPTPSTVEFTYPLRCSQSGYRVKVTLSAAKDWAGDEETNLLNNDLEAWGCEPYRGKPQGAMGAGGTAEASANGGAVTVGAGGTAIADASGGAVTVGAGGTAEASANGGAVSVGDVNAGGTAGNAIGVGDTSGNASGGDETLEGARTRPGGTELQSPVGSLDPTRRAGSVAGQPGGPPEVEGPAGASTTVQVDGSTTSAAPKPTTPGGGAEMQPAGQGGSAATKPVQPADLVISSLQVRGRGVNAGSECHPGDNRVLVTVRNAGAQPAAAFAVRLQVDGDDVDDEREVAGLEAGKETTVTFERVRVRSGEREFRATADAERKVTEGDEGNNSREMKARCRDAEDAEEKKKEEDDK